MLFRNSGMLLLKREYAPAQTIRHEMVQFVNNLNSFVKYDVIECCWDRFVSSVQKAADLDVCVPALVPANRNVV